MNIAQIELPSGNVSAVSRLLSLPPDTPTRKFVSVSETEYQTIAADLSVPGWTWDGTAIVRNAETRPLLRVLPRKSRVAADGVAAADLQIAVVKDGAIDTSVTRILPLQLTLSHGLIEADMSIINGQGTYSLKSKRPGLVWITTTETQRVQADAVISFVLPSGGVLL